MIPPDHWNARYEAGDTPWDLQGPSPVLRAVLDLGLLAGRERIFVPGCGLGHDVLQLASRGHAAVGVDFAPAAIEALRANAIKAGLPIEAWASDIFDLRNEPAGSFDGMWEYTCFCTVAPEMRARYVALATHLVRSGGRLVYLVFPTQTGPACGLGPPYSVTLSEIRERFDEHWTLILETEPLVTPAPRRGKEALLVLERR